jgi:hypothetical protein
MGNLILGFLSGIGMIMLVWYLIGVGQPIAAFVAIAFWFMALAS